MSKPSDEEAELPNKAWGNLPDTILTEVFSYLSVIDRFKAASVCRHWMHCLEIPLLWRRFHCGFFLPDQRKVISCLKKYGRYIKELNIELNQSQKENRINAVAAIDHLANLELEELKLTHLTVSFLGENPLFYAGHEFTTALIRLFKSVGESNHCSLKHVNLQGLESNFTNEFVDALSSGCKNLEYLNLLNKVLVCNISADAIVTLVTRCRKITVLHIYHASLSNNVLHAFSQPNREPLQRLGIVCRRQEKYGEDLISTAWSKLMIGSPDLKVELGFDHTCPLHRVSEIMKPEIPVTELHLVTFSRIYPEVQLAAKFYKEMLVKLVVQTRPSRELEEALVEIAQNCCHLHTLYVFCIVRKEIVDQILELCPVMKKKMTYILKSAMQPEPWTVGQEEGD